MINIATKTPRSAPGIFSIAVPARRQRRIRPERTPSTDLPPLAIPATALDAGPSLAERVEKERGQIFKALSIVECCWYATVTRWVVDDQEYMIPAFKVACDLLNDTAEALETIASECEKLRSGRASLRTRRLD